MCLFLERTSLEARERDVFRRHIYNGIKNIEKNQKEKEKKLKQLLLKVSNL